MDKFLLLYDGNYPETYEIYDLDAKNFLDAASDVSDVNCLLYYLSIPKEVILGVSISEDYQEGWNFFEIVKKEVGEEKYVFHKVDSYVGELYTKQKAETVTSYYLNGSVHGGEEAFNFLSCFYQDLGEKNYFKIVELK